LPDVGAYSVAAAAGADICRIPARVVEEEDKKPKRIPNIRPATWKRLQQALEFYEAEQFVEAIEVLESMVPRDGRRSRYNEAEVGQVHNMLAVSYWELDRPEKTIEHYEKVEGTPISLEGKANQLGQMVRANLPAAMQGLVVVPIFAGFDTAASRGRIFEYDVTGGRYEERDHAATGSGSLHADTVVKLGYRPSMARAAAVDLVLDALYVASDADAATGGPDPVRDVFPVVAVIDADGYVRLDDSELRRRTERLLRRHRSRRGGDEGSKS